MDDLISRAAAIDEIGKLIKEYRENGEDEVADGIIIARRYGVKQLPAVDAVPVKYGCWTRIHIKGKDYGKVYYQHENCAPLLYENPFHYCPECGAIMRLEELNAKENN